MNSLVEVRVPTYRRPSLLRRCLASLVSQSQKNWVALVLDDSPDQEGRSVVTEFSDPRIKYQPNLHNLGCCANLDVAFSPLPLAGGTHACVVEDDNSILPEFIESNLEALRSSGLSVLLRNQRIEIEHPNHPAMQSGRTTRSHVFGNSDLTLCPLRVRSAMFFSEGLSNGGLFWALDPKRSFAVGPCVKFSPMQEYCRSLMLSEDLLYCAEPLAVFSQPADGSTTREPLDDRRFNRGRQSILTRLLSFHGDALIDAGEGLCEITGRDLRELSAALLDCGWFGRRPARFGLPDLSVAVLKGIAKRLFVEDPLKEFWVGPGKNIIRFSLSKSDL